MAMDGGAGNLIAGLLNGYMQGQRLQEDRAEKNEQRKLQQQLLKFQIEQAKTKQLTEQRKNAIIEQLLPQFAGQQPGAQAPQPGQVPATPMSPRLMPEEIDQAPGDAMSVFPAELARLAPPPSGATPGGGLSQRLALATMPPEMLAALKLGAGIDLVDVAKFAHEQGRTTWKDAGNKLLRMDSRGNPTGEVLPKDSIQWHDTGVSLVATDQNGKVVSGLVLPKAQEIQYEYGFDPTTSTPVKYPRSKYGTVGGGGTLQTGPRETDKITQQFPGGREVTTIFPKGQPGNAPVAKIETKPVQPKPGEIAGRMVTAQAGAKNIQEIRSALILPNGKINRVLLAQANGIPVLAPGGIPFTAGRELRSKYLESVDTKIRAMTGAALNNKELDVYDDMFWPSNLDDDKTIISKLGRLEAFNNGYIERVAPGEKLSGGEFPIMIRGDRYKITSQPAQAVDMGGAPSAMPGGKKFTIIRKQ